MVTSAISGREEAALTSALSRDERARGSALSPATERNWRLGRGLVRHALEHSERVPAAEWHLSRDARGRPHVTGPGRSLPDVSLSHTDDLIVCSVARTGRVGVDCESVRPFAEMDGVVDLCFSDDAQREWRGLADDERTRHFFRTWTLFEASAKLDGMGISGRRAQSVEEMQREVPRERWFRSGFFRSHAVGLAWSSHTTRHVRWQLWPSKRRVALAHTMATS
jgi:phosphopantetheinyl transferase